MPTQIPDLCGVVLAAGRSTRTPGFNKLLQPLGGQAMVAYPVAHLREAGCDRVIVVAGHDRSKLKRELPEDVEWAVQLEPHGTGDAVAVAETLIGDARDVIVLYGDCPFLDAAIIRELVDAHRTSSAQLTIATATISEPQFLGHVLRSDDGAIEGVVSGYDLSDSKKPTEIFVGLSVWRSEALRQLIPQLTFRSRSGGAQEKELPDAVKLARRAGMIVETYSEIGEDDALGPNTPTQIEAASGYLQIRVNASLRSSRVTLRNSDSLKIDYTVQVGEGTTIHANTHLLGKTRVGRECSIGPQATLIDCVVGDNCDIGRGSWKDQVFAEGSRASDKLTEEHRYFRKPHFLIPEDKKDCFVVMPLKEPYMSLLENGIRPAIERVGMRCTVADVILAQGVVMDQVWEAINRAGVVIAELTEPNRNVWYELGLAHALNKRVVMLSAPSGGRLDLPFDTQHFRVVTYDPNKHDIGRKLESALRTVWT